MSEDNLVVEKILSANDLGLTGAHQAGLFIPKYPRILNFFPKLDSSTKNPRRFIHFLDENGEYHRFCFIYYNSRKLGCGTRNEYRLTCMTGYMRACNLKVGDTVVFSLKDGEYHVGYKRKAEAEFLQEENTLVLSGKWKVIHI